MKNLTQKELININGGENSPAFYAGRKFAENVYDATKEVFHQAFDVLRGIWSVW